MDRMQIGRGRTPVTVGKGNKRRNGKMDDLEISKPKLQNLKLDRLY
jgi:hypothetical protein